MPTLNEIAYDCLNTIRAGVSSDDDTLSLRQLYFQIHNIRAKLIREDLNKGRSLSQNLIQSLGCLDVTPIDASVCCGVTVDCNAFRSTERLPEPIELYQEDLITRVGSIIVGTRPFDIVPIDRIPYMGLTPFSGINKQTYAAIQDRYVYLFTPKGNKQLIKKISVSGIWANPTEAARFNSCDGVACYTEDSQYPISAHMIDLLKQMIMQSSLKIAAQAPSDNTGDAKSDPKPNSQQ